MDRGTFECKGSASGTQAATAETKAGLQEGEFETFGVKGLRSKEHKPEVDKNKLHERGLEAFNVAAFSTKLMVSVQCAQSEVLHSSE